MNHRFSVSREEGEGRLNLQGHFKPLLAEEDSQSTHTLYRKFETNIHRNDTARLVPPISTFLFLGAFIYIPTIGLIWNIIHSQR
jgi:hypothetical protein